MKKYFPAISYSSLSDFIHCKRKYYHHVVCGLQVRPEYLPEPIKLGRAWDSIIRSKYDPGYDPTKEINSLLLTPEQAARINAPKRAFDDLKILVQRDGLLGCQLKVVTQLLNTNLKAILDRGYDDHLVETKFSARPDHYTQKENLFYQLGTYFLSNPAWEYAIVEITRLPSLRMKDGESPEAYEERVYGDILSRPAYYFLGWERKTRTFGTKFWRSEFDLDEIHRTYCYVLHEIGETVKRGAWYPNNLACHLPAPCPYLPIKRSGVVSEEIFVKRQKKGGEDDGRGNQEQCGRNQDVL